MNRFRHSLPLRLAAIAALGAALALAGCGRKGPLDAPPSASISPPPPNEPSLGESHDPDTPGFRRPPREAAMAPAPSGTVPPQQRSFFLDFLIK